MCVIAEEVYFIILALAIYWLCIIQVEQLQGKVTLGSAGRLTSVVQLLKSMNNSLCVKINE